MIGWRRGSRGRTAEASGILLAASVAVGLLAAGAPDSVVRAAPSAGQAAVFRGGVDLVALAVTVTDSSGRHVTDLAAPQFRVFEDSVPQEITYFNHSNLPLSLALLIDTSASMTGRMRTAQNAAIGFVARLRPDDLAQIVAFNRDVRILEGFTGDQPKLEQAIRSATASGSTSLYNAVYVSLRELRKNRAAAESAFRRQAIVLFTDGEDTSSLVGYDEALDLARRSETAIYSIGLEAGDDPAAKVSREAAFVLREFAQETGGRAFFPTRIEDLASVYSQIADELASQYVLGYISKNPRRDGAWRRIAVRVGRDGVTARAKMGYFAPSGR